MKSLLFAGAALATSVAAQGAGCSKDPPSMENWYCNLVQKISYTGMGKAGKYQKITNMANGACDKEAYDYSGPLSPMDEGISWHFRGPMNLYQFAAYIPGSSSKQKRGKLQHRHAHGHQHFHRRNKEIREMQEEAEKRDLGDIVTATIDGQVQTWANDYAGPGAAAATPEVAAAAAPAAAPAKEEESDPIGYIASVVTSAAAAATSESDSSSHKSHKSNNDDDNTPVAAGDWKRIAYYGGGNGDSDGLVCLNNHGGDGSGVFDNTYGLSLSYSNSAGTGGASSPQQFGGNLTSNQEVVFFTDKKCAGDSCGYSRPGTVAYEGWSGDTKAFFFEFDMPYDGQKGFNMDMSSLWALNAQIPRTAQYNGCSCWDTGCGEIDVCEVLNSGNSKCKSTFHGNTPGGSSDYFDRPADKPVKMAVVMANSQIHIQQLDDSFDFGKSLSESDIKDLCNDSKDIKGIASSLFALVS